VAQRSNNNAKVKYLVLDVLKPHRPSIVDLTRELVIRLPGVTKISTSIVEIDQDTESIKMEIYGNDVKVEEIKRILREYGASLHSIDAVTIEEEWS